MCPFCFASAALVAVGTVSTGGVTALAIKRIFRARKGAGKNTSQIKSKENAS
jgi:hypothetical protein